LGFTKAPWGFTKAPWGFTKAPWGFTKAPRGSREVHDADLLGASPRRLGASLRRLGASLRRLRASPRRLGASPRRLGASLRRLGAPQAPRGSREVHDADLGSSTALGLTARSDRGQQDYVQSLSSIHFPSVRRPSSLDPSVTDSDAENDLRRVTPLRRVIYRFSSWGLSLKETSGTLGLSWKHAGDLARTKWAKSFVTQSQDQDYHRTAATESRPPLSVL
jgi:hypothetical protein